MKFLFAIALSFAAVAALPIYPIKVYPDPRCPRYDNPHSLIILPHLIDCSKFVTCVSGLGFEMRCPEGLEFSPLEKVCNYPQIAQCRRDQAVPYDPTVSRTTLSRFFLTRAAFVPSEHTTLEPVTVEGSI
ncbi:AAEL009540-PA [Aedes aegypti]|uniref:AAEL009540-PA n=1 Tax=Aedes aegypti TaxID=7159 RepID=Q16VK3_AEDAE|nr:AAEL009540-PA [Aedes aegypti]